LNFALMNIYSNKRCRLIVLKKDKFVKKIKESEYET
jgi:hypothetical protein